MKSILITGADGFIAKNLRVLLSVDQDIELLLWNKETSVVESRQFIEQADCIVSLAGVNRPKDVTEFAVNENFHTRLTEQLHELGKATPIAYSSSIQATNDTPYGASKRAGEEALLRYSEKSGAPISIFRLPNVFGKWGRPNYNSAVHTFCYNVARGIPITINDSHARLSLAYVDDVAQAFQQFITAPNSSPTFSSVDPVYETTVGEVADLISKIAKSRETLVTEDVGSGLTRAIYSTYLSYLPVDSFSYTVPNHSDARGSFVEMLKTKNAGQFSYFTAHPGITRGGHYHHTKTEKFLVLKGEALFKFRNVDDGNEHSIRTSGESPRIVETIPGWAHDVTNVGDGELICMLWANEIFDRSKPDTYAYQL